MSYRRPPILHPDLAVLKSAQPGLYDLLLFAGKCLSVHAACLCDLSSVINKVADRCMIGRVCNVLSRADICPSQTWLF